MKKTVPWVLMQVKEHWLFMLRQVGHRRPIRDWRICGHRFPCIGLIEKSKATWERRVPRLPLLFVMGSIRVPVLATSAQRPGEEVLFPVR